MKREQSDACISFAERTQTRALAQVCKGPDAVIASGPYSYTLSIVVIIS